MSEDLSSQKMQAAYDFIKSVLTKKYPYYDVLNDLFGTRTKHVLNAIDWFWNDKEVVLGKELRKKEDMVPREIAYARYKIEKDTLIDELDFYVHTQQKPPIDLMKIIYEEYAEKVIKVYDYYNEAGLIRESGIPASTHPHNLSITAYSMGFDVIGRTGLVYHDVPEDLFVFLTKKYNMKNDLDAYDEFIQRFIPEKLTLHINAITNKYDTIIKTLEDKLKNVNVSIISAGEGQLKGLKFNKKNVLEVLGTIKVKGVLEKYVYRTSEIINELNDSEDFLERLKWACYRDYIKDIADICIENKNFLAFDMKGIDLHYNSVGREAVKMSSRIKNALKCMTWVNKGYEIHTNYLPLNNHIMEIADNTLTYAYDVVSRDLIKNIYVSSFLFRAFRNLKQLTPIFFNDVDTDYKLKNLE